MLVDFLEVVAILSIVFVGGIAMYKEMREDIEKRKEDIRKSRPWWND